MSEPQTTPQTTSEVVRAFIYEAGQPLKSSAGTVEELLGSYTNAETAYVAVLRPVEGEPGNRKDFFVQISNTPGALPEHPYVIDVGSSGQLVVTLTDGTPVIVYAHAEWVEYSTLHPQP